MILAETFDHSIFRQSLARTFATGPDGLLEQGFNATLEVALPKVRVVYRHVSNQSQQNGVSAASAVYSARRGTLVRNLSPATILTLWSLQLPLKDAMKA
jgi:hypothetical protein